MYNHAPKDYICPLCLASRGVENKNTETRQADVIFKDKYLTAFISSRWWPNNPGQVIIIPNRHFENIYDLPAIYSDKIHRLAKRIALALKKVYHCDGVSVRQHNEPAGNQDVWHYHLQVFPRYNNDRLYESHSSRRFVPAGERVPYAEKLRNFLSKKR